DGIRDDLVTGVQTCALPIFSGFAPDSAVVIRISGERGYDLAFTVRTDDLGMYRGSFGSTAPAGRYSIDATESGAHALATMETARSEERRVGKEGHRQRARQA